MRTEKKEFNNGFCITSPTWGELLKFIQEKIDPKFYDKPVSFLFADEGASRHLTSVEKTQHDIYQHKEDAETYGSEDNIGSMEDLKEAHDDTDGPFNESDYVLQTEQGHPFLYYDEIP